MQQISIDLIRPYEKNPRNNTASVAKVAESIRQFGFLQPIVVDADGVILAGHTRYAAAKQLGLTTVPVLYAKDLTPAEARAYRIADNKVGEGSLWVDDLLTGELEALQAEDPGFDPVDFGFEPPAETRHRKAWKTVGKRCGMVENIMIRNKCGFLYTSFFNTGPKGRPIDEIKADQSLVQPFADNLCNFIQQSLGRNLAEGGWCLCTTPRRRHTTGFHFATAICEAAAPQLGIPFRNGVLTATNRDRVAPVFVLSEDPPEKNIILYDDIMTTGMTMKESRARLMDAGHTVLPVVAIRNQ